MKKILLLILFPLFALSQKVEYYSVKGDRLTLALLNDKNFEIGFENCTNAAIGRGAYRKENNKITLYYDLDTTQYFNTIFKKMDCSKDSIKIEFQLNESLNSYVAGNYQGYSSFSRIDIFNKLENLYTALTDLDGYKSITIPKQPNDLEILISHYPYLNSPIKIKLSGNFCGKIIVSSPIVFTKFIRKTEPEYFKIVNENGQEILVHDF